MLTSFFENLFSIPLLFPLIPNLTTMKMQSYGPLNCSEVQGTEHLLTSWTEQLQSGQ